jgi:hypothetical protein
MQNNNEWDIGYEAHIQDFHFYYSDYGEICQGGPCTGNLMMNNKTVAKMLFLLQKKIVGQQNRVLPV